MQDLDFRLHKFFLQSAARRLLPEEKRLAGCLRWPVPDAGGIGLWVSHEYHRAHFKGLQTCGSVWQCMPCSSKITERRRVELREALDRSGYEFALVTYTLQHSVSDLLVSLLDDLRGSYTWMKNTWSWKTFKADSGLVGSVTALEVTHGVNGWHPHLHDLQVYQAGRALGAVDFFKESWLSALQRRERTASYKHGCDYRDAATDVANYIAKFGHDPKDFKHPFKWGQAEELTKAPVKMSRGDAGYTPFQLLDSYASCYDFRAGVLFREYAQVFKGRHQLQWSEGLRALLGLGQEAADQELAERVDDDSWLLAVLSLDDWRLVLGNDARGELLEVASLGDIDKLGVFVESLRPAVRSREDRVRRAARARDHGRGLVGSPVPA